MSEGVCEPRHENGSREHRETVAFFVLNMLTLPPQHMENFSRPLEMTEYHEHMHFAGTKYVPKAEPLLKMNSAADDHQQQGQVTTQHE